MGLRRHRGPTQMAASSHFTSTPNFPQFTGSFAVPLDETLVGGRVDSKLTSKLSAFYRFNHDYNVAVTGFGGINLAAFANLNNTNSHVAGIDYTRGRWTHSGRFSYLNFNNFIVDANAPQPELPLPSIRLKGPSWCALVTSARCRAIAAAAFRSRATGFKSFEIGITWSYRTTRTTIDVAVVKVSLPLASYKDVTPHFSPIFVGLKNGVEGNA